MCRLSHQDDGQSRGSVSFDFQLAWEFQHQQKERKRAKKSVQPVAIRYPSEEDVEVNDGAAVEENFKQLHGKYKLIKIKLWECKLMTLILMIYLILFSESFDSLSN